MTDKRDATEAEQWLDNFNLYIDGGVHGYYPACNDHVVPGELDKLFAEVRAEARRAALEDAANIFDERAATHRHTVYTGSHAGSCGACRDDRRRASAIRSLMEPKETL